jgi:hypothetical protein
MPTRNIDVVELRDVAIGRYEFELAGMTYSLARDDEAWILRTGILQVRAQSLAEAMDAAFGVAEGSFVLQ